VSVPARFGRYAVRRRLGAGGFATVWLAYDEQLDSPVAVKVLAENWTEDHQVRRRFEEEGRYLRRVDSPCVVTVYDAGELDDGRPYLVMAYADQGTLADRLEVAALTTAQTLGVVQQVGAGLQALHAHDILHRDIKPANVLLTSRHPGARPSSGEPEEDPVADDPVAVRAMVADLGLGKALDQSSRLTMIAGTPTYVAPEQARGEPLDARADQYSLAALAYVLLCGHAPFDHASLHAAGQPGERQPAPLCPDLALPAEVDDVLQRGLAFDREERWPDVAEFVAALTAALAPVVSDQAPALLPIDPELTQAGAGPGRTPGAAPWPAPGTDPEPAAPRPGRRLLQVGAAAAVVLAAVAGGFLVGQRPDPETTVHDRSGTLAAVVPSAWDHVSTPRGWRPDADGKRYPVLSVGTVADWAEDDAESGVFAGILPRAELPTELPGHPECEAADAPATDPVAGRPARTVVHDGCPGGLVAERVVQVADDRVLWVQVRAGDSATLEQVLAGVAVR